MGYNLVMQPNKITLEQSLLKELFDYKNGQLVWKKVSLKKIYLIGQVAGATHHSGYRTIKINDIPYPAHRLMWVYHNGTIDENLQIDHINGDKTDNSIENLRLVTAQENAFNRSRLNAKGYTWNKKTNKWQAQIKANNIFKYLGSFLTEQEARNAYLKAVTIYHKIGIL